MKRFTIFAGFNLGRQSATMEILGFYRQTNPALNPSSATSVKP